MKYDEPLAFAVRGYFVLMPTQPTLDELAQRADAAIRTADVAELESIAGSAVGLSGTDARLLEDQVRMVIAAKGKGAFETYWVEPTSRK